MPWVNVRRQRAFGFLVSETRRRLHVEPQQPRAPAHALVATTRCSIPTARRSTCATRTPARSGRRCPGRRAGGGAVRGAPRLRLLALAPREPRARAGGDACSSPPRRSGEGRRACASRTAARARAGSRSSRYARLVLGVLPEDERARGRDRAATRAGARCSRGNRLAGDFARRRRLRRRGPPGAAEVACTHATAAAFLGARRLGRGPAALVDGGDARRRARRAASIRASRSQVALERRARRDASSAPSCSARRRTPTTARALVARYRAAAAPSTRRSTAVRAAWDETLLGAVRGRDAGARPRPHGERLARLPDARAAASGAASAFYQSGGAFGFRDQLQDAAALVLRAPGSDARADPAPRGAPVRRGRRAPLVAPAARTAARARASPTTSLWLPYVTALLRRDATGDRGVLDERAGFVDARACSSRRGRGVPAARARRRARARLRALLPRASTARSRGARTACRSWAPATGTTA